MAIRRPRGSQALAVSLLIVATATATTPAPVTTGRPHG